MTTKRGKGALSPEDETLWRDIARTVRRRRAARKADEAPPEDEAAPSVETPPTRAEQSPLPPRITPPSPPRKPAVPPLTPGDVTGLDKRAGQRLSRGRRDIDARIDLHGMTRLKAHDALRAFIDRAWSDGQRCLLVITGKGTRAENGVGVIRASLEDWLNAPDVRPRVLSFTPAQPKDGGGGAFYVLLKRRDGKRAQ